MGGRGFLSRKTAWTCVAVLVSAGFLHTSEGSPKVVGNKKDSDDEGTVSIVNIEDQNKTQYYSQNFDAGNYNYGYDIKPSGPIGQFHHENKAPDSVVYGCYGYLDPNEEDQITFYISDAWGYRPVKQEQPAEIFFPADNPEGTKDMKGTLTPWSQIVFPEKCIYFAKEIAASNPKPLGPPKVATSLSFKRPTTRQPATNTLILVPNGGKPLTPQSNKVTFLNPGFTAVNNVPTALASVAISEAIGSNSGGLRGAPGAPGPAGAPGRSFVGPQNPGRSGLAGVNGAEGGNGGSGGPGGGGGSSVSGPSGNGGKGGHGGFGGASVDGLGGGGGPGGTGGGGGSGKKSGHGGLGGGGGAGGNGDVGGPAGPGGSGGSGGSGSIGGDGGNGGFGGFGGHGKIGPGGSGGSGGGGGTGGSGTTGTAGSGGSGGTGGPGGSKGLLALGVGAPGASAPNGGAYYQQPTQPTTTVGGAPFHVASDPYASYEEGSTVGISPGAPQHPGHNSPARQPHPINSVATPNGGNPTGNFDGQTQEYSGPPTPLEPDSAQYPDPNEPNQPFPSGHTDGSQEAIYSNNPGSTKEYNNFPVTNQPSTPSLNAPLRPTSAFTRPSNFGSTTPSRATKTPTRRPPQATYVQQPHESFEEGSTVGIYPEPQGASGEYELPSDGLHHRPANGFQNTRPLGSHHQPGNRNTLRPSSSDKESERRPFQGSNRPSHHRPSTSNFYNPDSGEYDRGSNHGIDYSKIPGAVMSNVPVIFYPDCNANAFSQPAIVPYCPAQQASCANQSPLTMKFPPTSVYNAQSNVPSARNAYASNFASTGRRTARRVGVKRRTVRKME